jgi:uncharacterized protein YajQ (UPF0234 family)
MPSFDVVSETDVQEVDNAINQAQKEIAGRYDFKGAKFELAFDKQKEEIKLSADDESRLVSMFDIIGSKLVKRGIDLSALDVGKVEAAGGMMQKQLVKIKQGLETEIAKKIVKVIKESKLKVEAAIQDKQVRVTAKNIDDLQEIIALLKSNSATLNVPLQFVNMKR